MLNNYVVQYDSPVQYSIAHNWFLCILFCEYNFLRGHMLRCLGLFYIYLSSWLDLVKVYCSEVNC